MIKTLNPYIHYNGHAAQAIELYTSALGAKVETLMRWSEGQCPNAPTADPNLIMHSEIMIGGNKIMLNDTTPDHPASTNGNVEITLDYSELPEMTKAFAALADGGKVIMEPQDTFWGAKFGVVSDRFGVRWMFNCDLPRK